MFNRKNFEKGISTTAVVIIFVIAIILMTVGVIINVESERVKRQRMVKEEIVTNLENAKMSARQSYEWMVKLVWEGERGEKVYVEEVDALKSDLNQTITQISEKYLDKRNISTIEEIITPLEYVYYSAVAYKDMLDFNITITKKEEEVAKMLRNLAEENKSAVVNILDTEISNLTSYKNNVIQNLTNIKEALENQKAQLENEKNKFEETKTKELKQYDEQIWRLESDIEQKSRRVTAVTTKVEINGEITKVDSKNKFAYINLGKDDNIKRGLRFKVVTFTPAGEQRTKGEIEVKEIYDDFALALITKEYNKLDLIVSGDYIVNPFHKKDRKVVVALIGKTFKYDGYSLTLEQFTKKINQTGAIIQENIDPSINFVITGEEAEKDETRFRKILELGIPRLKPQDVKDFFY